MAAIVGVGGWIIAMGQGSAAPTAIHLSSTSVQEDCPDYTVVGTLSAVDPAPGAVDVFTLVGGDGSADNREFLIVGDQLLVWQGSQLDFETQPNLSIRVMVADATGQSCEQVFAIALTDDLQEDADGDGLSQEMEEDVYGTSDLLFDTDGDGFSDGAEVAAGTSPTNPDDWPATWIIGWGSTSNGAQATPREGGFDRLATGQGLGLAIKTTASVVAWGGQDTYGQCTVPADLGAVVDVAVGGDDWLDDSAYGLALKSDGTVVAWGYDQQGQFVVPDGLDQVIAIAAGRTHSLALRRDGTVVAWGSNPFGSVAPPAGLSDVVAISAGGFHSLALRGDGTVVAWGSIFNGSDWEEASTPVGLADVVAISAGRFHCLALKYDGTVVAWGYDLNGQTDVPADLNDVVAVAAGGFHSLALRSDGTVVAWGLNASGQTTVPVAARDGVKWIAAGLEHSLALRRNAGLPQITSSPRIVVSPDLAFAFPVLLAGGDNSTPVFSAIGLPDGVAIDAATGLISGTVSAPMRRSIQIRVNTNQGLLTQAAWLGAVEGSAPTAVVLNSPGVLENSVPGVLVGTLSAVDPDVGDTHTFELVDGVGCDDNRLFRIQDNQLLVGQTITRDFETDPGFFSIRIRARDAALNPYEQILTLPLLDDRTEDADGDGLTEAQEQDIYHTSDELYDTDGDGFGDLFEIQRGFLPNDPTSFPSGQILVAWGDNTDGQTDVPAGLANVIALAAGSGHNLALKSDGTVVAWGANGYGQSTLPDGLAEVTGVAAGAWHSLALMRDGSVAAWGNNDVGQTSVPAGLSEVVAIAAGGFHNLALRRDGTVVAWGSNACGQAAVPADLTGVVAVAAGGFHSLALKSDGTVVAWGSEWGGAVSVPDGLSGVIAIAAGGYHGLALKYDGSVAAWGDDDEGQATPPATLGAVTAIAAGWLHSLALLADGTTVGWGDDSHLQTERPLEAIHVQMIATGYGHNLALRQADGFPSFADLGPVRSWPGETLEHPTAILNATPNLFAAMGLPADLAIDPLSGMVSGTVTSGERQAVRILVDSDQGPLSRVIWFDTADGVAPTQINLSSAVVAENSPAGTVVGTLSVVDPNAGDSATFTLAYVPEAPDSFRFVIEGNQLVVHYDLAVDYEAGDTQLLIRVVAHDSASNMLARDFVLQVFDNGLEDEDGDGIDEAMEDLLGTSDESFDDFNVADPDHDGVASLIEYAFNLDPKVAGPPVYLVAGAGSTAGLPAVNLIDDGSGQRRLRIEYLRRVAAGLTYTPEFAGGLAPEDWAPATGPITVTPINADWERCVVEDSQGTADAACRFGRVAVHP